MGPLTASLLAISLMTEGSPFPARETGVLLAQAGPADPLTSGSVAGKVPGELETRIIQDYPIAPEPPDPESLVVTTEPIERKPLTEFHRTEQPPRPTPSPKGDAGDALGRRAELAAVQVLLDRSGISPGVIDGLPGSNLQNALAAYRQMTGFDLDVSDAVGITQRLAEAGGDPFTTYVVTPEDAAGPFIASVPADYGEKATLEHLGFTSVAEMLAERFHMDEGYLKLINPQAEWRPGTIVKVVDTGPPVRTPVARIVADKGRKQVRAYAEDGSLVAAYPATIGSADTPSPTGTHTIRKIVLNPEYTYNPKVNFKQGNNDKVLRIPPGPNGPVGSVWIGLSRPTYGIHGTPDPSKIGKTGSHGCVRLTNWDARELARLVKPGVTVEFIEADAIQD